ncbi:beta-Ala-His dipeptidase [Clostridium bovifaecis]|uniref:Cytosol non-specific dipeptidase n=1 Tax=Clostridium bovifaecis TaxID=2184719 RepID=A0A6I6EY90_9CLOT|nr:beta-Ala-His dipeptidase [Clostridium bovifaecis]
MSNLDNILKDLSPSLVFKYFEEISRIPRCSGSEKAISDYLVNFARAHNLEVIQDEVLNVIIKKEATKGYENAPVVILQGHMDMVCEKNKETEHDFEKDPIKLRIEGDFVKATGTTLGADNGIAIAYCLAILASNDIEHPSIEVLITTEEETGMGGASGVKAENLSGKTLINIDSEEEGELLSSCAGGVRNSVRLTIELEEKKQGFIPYKVIVKGLKGGHSGMDIDKGRGNSNKLMGRLLNDINSQMEIYISDINGGAKMNAIPREAEAVIFIREGSESTLNSIVKKMQNVFKDELRVSDPGVALELAEMDKKPYRVFSRALTDKIIALLMLIPQGVQTMSMDIKGLVQSSTNLGVVTTTEDEVTFESAIRSSVKSLKESIVAEIECLCKLVGAAMALESDYPAWEYRENSYIREVFKNVYKDMYGSEPKVTAIHAGLECGILKDIIGDIDMISFGPNMYDVHTPEEKLSISSTKRTYEYLIQVLKAIK